MCAQLLPSSVNTPFSVIMFQLAIMAAFLKENLDIQAALEQMRDGSSDAFEAVLSFHERQIFTHLVRLVGNKDEASDLLQETFIRLYKNRKQIAVDGNIKSWLYKVATNIAYDHFRKKKRENLVSIDDDETFETFSEELSYTNVEQQILSADLENALEKIRPHYKNILLLYYREGFSYEEIAEILDTPLNTIKTHLRRARQELAKLLQESYG